jgi:CHAT domain-containing protein/Tfp pilus assembly protein PilF
MGFSGKRLSSAIAFLVAGICFLGNNSAWAGDTALSKEFAQLIQQAEASTYGQALELFQRALSMSRKSNDRNSQAQVLNSMGDIYQKAGQFYKALESYREALSLDRQSGNISSVVTTLNTIGQVYDATGHSDEAVTNYLQALELAAKLQLQDAQANTLSNLALAYENLGQQKQALETYQRALALSRSVGNHEEEVLILNNLANLYVEMSQPEQADRYYQQVLPLAQAIGYRPLEATVLDNLGVRLANQGKLSEALEYHRKALSLSREVAHRAEERASLANIGSVLAQMGQKQQAIEALEQSLQISLQMRSGFQRSDRSVVVRSAADTVNLLVRLLIEKDQVGRAYEWANLMTASGFVDYSRLIKAKVADPLTQKAIDDWNRQNQQLQVLQQQLNGKSSSELTQKLQTQETFVNRQADEISRRFPEVADLFETTPTDIARLRATLVKGQVLLHPAVLESINGNSEYLLLFVLTRDSIQVHKQVINHTELDALVLQYYESLKNPFDSDYSEDSVKLHDLLVRPVMPWFKAASATQLSVIVTDKLRYLPFETLYDSKTNRYLIEAYPVNYLTFLSTRTFKENSDPRRRILALGNPFPQGERNLPGAAREAELIAQAVPGSLNFTGKQASLQQFKASIPKFSILHLATHGCFQDAGCPNLTMESNTLLFSDQSISIADAAQLSFKGVELITLSACQTAVNTESKGEGITSLAYLFERAGAHSVIASLWAVEDNATKELMVRFYENLNQKMSKTEALRQAKLQQIDRHPFFWSPFILIGDGQ